MRHVSNQKKQCGFTLIELLVVIAIMGLLASVVFAVVSRSRLQAQFAHMQVSHRELNKAITAYYLERNDWPPAGSVSIYQTCASGSAPCSSWSAFFTTHLSGYYPSVLRPALTPVYLQNDVLYSKGTVSSPSYIDIFNSMTGLRVGCVQVYDGYYLSSFTSFNQQPVTLNDGGMDPDGIESWDGDVRFRYGMTCP